MKQKLISLMLALALMLCMMPAAAAAQTPAFSGTCGEKITWTLDPDKGVLSINGEGAIPDYTYSEGAPWYECRSRVLKVVLSEKITGIGDFAFCSCDSLVEVDASACTLDTIGKGAFEGCVSIESLTIRPGTSLAIGDDAFFCCVNLSEFKLSPAEGTSLDSLTIGAEAFASCVALKALNLGVKAGTIGRGAFDNCSLLADVTLPKDCARLERDTFSGCGGLTRVVLPETLAFIGKRCFSACTALSELSFPETLKEVEPAAFTEDRAMLLTFAGDAPAFAAIDACIPSFPSGSTLRFPYETKGWAWPLCKGYAAEYIFADLDKTFTDLTPGAWYIPSVRHVYYTGLMNGLREGTFAPANPMNRAQLVTVLYRVAGSPAVTSENPFTDVVKDSYYYDAVLWAQSKGIVTGLSATTFSPTAQITRQQVCTILFRYATMLKLPTTLRDPLTSFSDTDALADYARDPMSWCVAAQFINGKSGGLLDPRGNATRAEIAKILTGFHTYLAREEILAKDDWKEEYEHPDPTKDIDREDPIYIYATEILETINKKRAESGLNALKWSDKLYLAARIRAKELSVDGFFGHTRPDGTGYATVFTQFDITSNTRNEIVAHGYTTAQSLVDVWATASSTSPVLKAVVYSEAAVGVYYVAPPADAKEGEQGKYCYALLVTG